MKRLFFLFFSLCVLYFSCDMNKQTRKTTPEKPKITTTKDAKETLSSLKEAQKEASQTTLPHSSPISRWLEQVQSPTPQKASKKQTSSSWQRLFDNLVLRLEPATFVFTLTGGALVLHLLLKGKKK